MRILVTGSRDWPDDGSVEKFLSQYILEKYPFAHMLPDRKEVTIVDGKCPFGGTDEYANRFARQHGFNPEQHDADDFGPKHDKTRFAKRNQHMVDLGADVCLAFCLGESRGTEMTIKFARKAGIEVRAVYRSKNG